MSGNGSLPQELRETYAELETLSASGATPEEIERAAGVSSRQNRVWRMVKRIARRRYGSDSETINPSDE